MSKFATFVPSIAGALDAALHHVNTSGPVSHGRRGMRVELDDPLYAFEAYKLFRTFGESVAQALGSKKLRVETTIRSRMSGVFYPGHAKGFFYLGSEWPSKEFKRLANPTMEKMLREDFAFYVVSDSEITISAYEALKDFFDFVDAHKPALVDWMVSNPNTGEYGTNFERNYYQEKSIFQELVCPSVPYQN